MLESLTRGRTIRVITRVIAILLALIAGLLFASAIIIFQQPDNRYWVGEYGPDGMEDAFVLTVIGLCIFWDTVFLIAMRYRKKPIRPKKARLPDALTWLLLTAFATLTCFISKPFWDGSSPEYNRARRVEGAAVIMTFIASIPHFVLFWFTIRDHRAAKWERAAKASADEEAAEHVEHVEAVECQNCKSIDLPPAYEHVEIETDPVDQLEVTETQDGPVDQMMASKAQEGPLVGAMPVIASQSGLSAVDDEGRVVGA